MGCYYVTGIAVNGSKQFADAGGIGDGCVMLGHYRRQGSAQVRSHVPLGAFSLHGVAKDLSAALTGAVRRFVNPPAFNSPENLEHIHGTQLGDWPRADVRKYQ